MAKLTIEQKQELKKWEKNLRIWFILTMIYLFVIFPFIFLSIDNFFQKREGIFYVVLIAPLLFLWFFSLYVRHLKRCPNCKARIGGWNRIISLPDKCYNCGVSFK